jgi:predicted GNAT family N-acyltransferase
MYFIKAIMPCHIAGQHAGIGRVQISADQRESHAGDGIHAETLEHADMAVATANKNNIAKDGLVGGLHESV